MTKKAPPPPALMSTDRPLDALLPELREAYEPIPYAPVHQRVLEVDTGDSGYEWVFACWEDPGGARALNAALRDLIEATFLAHLSQPPATDLDALARPFRRLRLYNFSPVSGPVGQAVAPFGFAPAAYSPEQHVGRMAALSEEAQRMGRRAPLSPHSVWVAEVEPPSPLLLDLQRDLQAALGEETWGQHPGKPSHALAQALGARAKGAALITPNLRGLRAVEAQLVSQARGRVRWLPPLVFQGLCDLIGVVMAEEWGYRLQWAVCEQDPIGLYPPPHYRLEPSSPDGQPEHFLVGQQVLQWCVMPLLPGEQVPPLTDWLAHTFGQALSTRLH
jgi:hypothetical protein